MQENQPTDDLRKCLRQYSGSHERQRIFERFGFNLPQQQPQQQTTKLVENFDMWTFPNYATDWINPDTVETLSGYLEPIELSYLLNSCINIDHC
jgi:hypothetical protein